MTIIASEGQGERLWFGGGEMTIKVSAADVAGAFLLVEDVAPRGKTTPLHIHETFDETFYVVDGTVLLHIDGEEHVADAGTVAAIPRGIPHAFLVTSEHARFLVLATPGETAERFYREGGETPTDGAAPPPLDIQKVLAAGEATGGMKVLGPPPFATVSARG